MKITTSAASTAADLEETTVSSEITRALPRRAMFAVSGTAVLAAAAACSSGSTVTGTTAATSAPASGPATSAGRSSGSSSPSAASSASSAVAPPTVDPTTPAAPPSEATPAGTPVASVADVQAAGSVVVEAADGPLLLAYSDGTVVAHTAVCTHQQCTIAASGMCPCHGSRFNITTGAVENGPALRPLAQENVTVTGGQVYLA